MRRFDCLSLDCPLLGPHLLEASAGTGKTFSIEHIFVRLILESIEVDQILAVTFTRAATRELKARIRGNLEKALGFIQNREAPWPYLSPYLGSDAALQKIGDALANFDLAQIFTIHSFCYRILQEFAFEAKVGAVTDPDERKVPERLRRAARDFLENGVDLCPEQFIHLMSQKKYNSIEKIVDELVKLEKSAPSLTLSEVFAKCKAALHLEIDRGKLLEDFRACRANYKVGDFGDLEAQVIALAEVNIPILLKERGKIFDFFALENRKVKFVEPPFLHYPGFFERAKEIAPLLRQEVFPMLQAAWNPIGERILEEEGHFGPDDILSKMRQAIEDRQFLEKIQKKYEAVIIDEFQDTDEVQWDIFEKLFFSGNLKALYLVGDPKQSIYRFRKADIYTYLKARDLLGEDHLYHLDTNFRSSKELIGALNALFNRNWLQLPKIGTSLPYHPVKAGAQIENLEDGKGAIHFFTAEGEPGPLFDEAFLPYAVSEIERLKGKCAILVKDRRQVEKAIALLKERGIAAVARSHVPIGETAAFQMVTELFRAVQFPRDLEGAKILSLGPFAHLDPVEAKSILDEEGLVPFARLALQGEIDGDLLQIFELLFEWEKKEGFSFEGLNRYLKSLKNLSAEEGGRRRMEVDEEAVQVMTIHISKGLEFDVVFALGLIARHEAEEKELEAEKLRQLYVAMTRAKKRLYVPVALSKNETETSPLELFMNCFEGSFLEKVQEFESITVEQIGVPWKLGPSAAREKKEIKKEKLLPKPYTPLYLASFSNLAKSETKEREFVAEGITLQSMPRGTETGILIHKIFEILFASDVPIWRDELQIEQKVKEVLENTSLSPWKEPVFEMVKKTIRMPLQTEEEFFSLADLEPKQVQVEAEFLFSRAHDFVKGFIDLIFVRNQKVYFLDWKTNWLENYSDEVLEQAMKEHDYLLQAALYKEAICRHFQMEWGGAFYLFVRGGAYLYV
jgi:exodeoxyribonuclease V beta subunit